MFLLHSSLPCASVAGGVSRPRSGALVDHIYVPGTATEYTAVIRVQITIFYDDADALTHQELKNICHTISK